MPILILMVLAPVGPVGPVGLVLQEELAVGVELAVPDMEGGMAVVAAVADPPMVGIVKVAEVEPVVPGSPAVPVVAAVAAVPPMAAVPVVQKLSHLPIFVDPSHAAGKRPFIGALSLAGVAAGADGLMLEVHPNPDHAPSDGQQSLNFDEFAELMPRLAAVAKAVDRSVATSGALARV